MPKHKKTMKLEVNPSIIEKNITFIKENKLESEINKYLNPSLTSTEPPSKMVKPLPGFCVKIWTKLDGKKVFINVCHTIDIHPPKNISDDELVKILKSEEPSSPNYEYRVPMSIGEPHTECDKTGIPAPVYDVAINTDFFEKIQQSDVFHSFFLIVLFAGIQEKYQIQLEMEKYVILKYRKCIGTLHSHNILQRNLINCIERDHTPLIEEIEPTIQSDENLTVDKNEMNNKYKQIKYKLYKEPKKGNIEFLVGEFYVDRMLLSRDLTLDVGEDRIIVEVLPTNQLVDIFIPYSIKQDTVKATLDQNTRILTVKMAIGNIQ